ncbi:MAG TPA: ANTAR domain-containing protein [Burkholderiaceae bacterium]|nr:ANTAR domain-containing protein [Burkholderiaceae bacterium]
MSSGELMLAVITASATVPDLDDEDGWAEADRLRVLVAGLRDAGYRVGAVLPADADLHDRLVALAPDVLVVDAESGARDAIEHVVWASRDAPRPIVLFTDEHDPSHVREAVAQGVVAYVVAGMAAERVRPVIDVAIARFEHERELRALATRGRERDKAQVVVARAKQLLMTRHQLSEPEAYARLRRTAMNQGLTVGEVAQRLLELGDLFT